MHPILSENKRLFLYVTFWLGLGCLIALVVHFSDNPDWPGTLLFALPLTLLYGFVCLSAYYLCRSFPLGEKEIGPLLAVMFSNAIVTALLWTAVSIGWKELLAQFGFVISLQKSLVATMFGIGLVLFLLSMVAHYLIIMFEKAEQAGRRELETHLLAREAELRLLRAQIDPHFIFNSLNSISALTTSDPEGARSMTLLLADFLRQSLKIAVENRISLGEELKLILNFLAIEKIRFGNRLQIETEVDKNAAGYLVPPMILQPLVENAVKHGIGQLIRGGTVCIRTAVNGNRLHLAVENPVDDTASVQKAGGVGLVNIRQRLAAMYDGEAALQCSRNGNMFRAEIVLPLNEQF